MSASSHRRFWRRARTAAGLPGRVVAVEDRTGALEARVASRLDEMRAELAELRILVSAQLEADAETAALLGSLLQASEERLSALESLRPSADAPGSGAP